MTTDKAKGTRTRKAKTSGSDKVNGSNGQARGAESMPLIPESELAPAPEAFQEVFGERVLGWWALVPGNVIQGIIRDSFETKSKFADAKKVYKIELTDATAGKRGCMVVSAAEDDEGAIITAKKGDLVGVDEKGFLKSLSRVAVGQEIWIAYRGKEGPSADYPQGRHVFVGPLAKPAKVNAVTGEVTS